jgi:hypothetical protein
MLILSTQLRLDLPSGLLPSLAFLPTTYMRSSSPSFVLHVPPTSVSVRLVTYFFNNL